MSTSSQESGLCSCGKLGLNHSHTNCSNVSTRGSSYVPSDVSTCDFNVYRSQSPAEMGHTQNEGKGPPCRQFGTTLPVSENSLDSDILPVISSQYVASASDIRYSAAGRYHVPVAEVDTCAESLSCTKMLNALSHRSIENYGSLPTRENLVSDLSELNFGRNKHFGQNQPMPPATGGLFFDQTIADRAANMSQFCSKSNANNNENCDNLKEPKFNFLLPMHTNTTETDNNDTGTGCNVRTLSMPGVPQRAHQFTEKYSRNLDMSVSLNDTATLSPFVSNWHQSGSESIAPCSDYHNSLDCHFTKRGGVHTSETTGSTSLLNRSVPIIPCSCATGTKDFPKNETGHQGNSKEHGIQRLVASPRFQYLPHELSGNYCSPPGPGVSNFQTPVLGAHLPHTCMGSSACAVHKTDQRKTWVSLQWLSDLHGHTTQKERDLDLPLQKGNDFDTCKEQCTYHDPANRLSSRRVTYPYMQECRQVDVPTFGSLSSISIADAQLETAIPTGAADELADVHDIHTSDEINISPGSSSSSENLKHVEGARRSIKPCDCRHYIQARDSMVATHPEGMVFVLLEEGLFSITQMSTILWKQKYYLSCKENLLLQNKITPTSKKNLFLSNR